jgi:hypothetical protein
MVVMDPERLAPSIVEEFAEGKFDIRPVEERYYTKKYSCDDSDDGVYTFLVHTNKLCVIKLAETHPIIVQNLTIKSVNFQVTDKLNRLDNKVSGKGKRGAQLLTNTSVLCTIQCEERSEPFLVRTCMIAKLLEVNEALVTNPELLKADHLNYIAIISPRMSDYEVQLENLRSEEQYREKIAQASK